MATDAFFQPAKIFNELDLFQRDPGWLAAFPDGGDDGVVPRGEIYVSLLRERTREAEDQVPLWQLHADQWVEEVEDRPGPAPVPPAEVLRLCMSADPTCSVMGTETEIAAEEGVFVCYTWAELRMSPQQAKDLLRALCDKFQQAYPDAEGM